MPIFDRPSPENQKDPFDMLNLDIQILLSRFSTLNNPQSTPPDWCQPGLVRWRPDPVVARQMAQESGSLILLFQLLGRLDEANCCPNARLARHLLFSNETVADYINATFEPVWESARPVPIVSIDFQNGHVLSRALPGNIATYVCASDGQVLDILPGMYTSAGYLTHLRWFKTLEFISAMPLERRQTALLDYHRDAIKRMSLQGAYQPSKVHASFGAAGASYNSSAPTGKPTPASTRPDLPEISPGIQQLTMEDARQWNALVEDTKANETARRTAIHEKLSTSHPVTPDGIVKWLYREVLHSDLDDPYLGLGKLPF